MILAIAFFVKLGGAYLIIEDGGPAPPDFH